MHYQVNVGQIWWLPIVRLSWQEGVLLSGTEVDTTEGRYGVRCEASVSPSPGWGTLAKSSHLRGGVQFPHLINGAPNAYISGWFVK